MQPSPVTKRNPRPRKYASAADRQAAYRARNEMLEFRAEAATAKTINDIANTLDTSRSDLLLSMVKFALTNHDWARFGLTHKTIPFYQGNPTMATTKKPSPAQLAARAKFADMARMGGFAKKKARTANKMASQTPKLNPKTGLYANINAKKKRIAAGSGEKMRKPGQPGRPTAKAFVDAAKTAKNNPITETVIYGLAPGETRDYMEEIMYGGGQKLTKDQVDMVIAAATKAGYHSIRVSGIDMTKIPNFANAIKKTRRKTNPMQGALLRLHGNMYGQVRQDGNGLYTATVLQKVNTGIGEEMDFYESKEFKTKAGAARFLANHGKTKSNPAKSNPAKKSKPYCYLCILSGGDQYGLDERTAVSMAFSSTLMRHAYKCYAIPPKVEKNPAFQAYAGSQQMFYMSLAEMKKKLQQFN